MINNELYWIWYGVLYITGKHVQWYLLGVAEELQPIISLLSSLANML